MGMVFLSSGLRVFKELDDLRIFCDLGIDSIVHNTGGFLPVSHVSYRNWHKLIKKTAILGASGKNVVVQSSVSRSVSTRLDMGIQMLGLAIGAGLLPIDRNKGGVRTQQRVAMDYCKTQLVRHLREAELVTSLADINATMSELEVAVELELE